MDCRNPIDEAYANLVSVLLEMPLKIVRESNHPRTVAKYSHWLLEDGFKWFTCLLAGYGKEINKEEYSNWVKSRCPGNIPTSSCQKK